MTFNKEEYWKNKENNVGSKRPRPTVTAPKDLKMSFGDNGEVIAQNRAYRRRNRENNIFRKKGFIEHLFAIRIKRTKNGKPSFKMTWPSDKTVTSKYK